jgi:hypothetical protein
MRIVARFAVALGVSGVPTVGQAAVTTEYSYFSVPSATALAAATPQPRRACDARLAALVAAHTGRPAPKCDAGTSAKGDKS